MARQSRRENRMVGKSDRRLDRIEMRMAGAIFGPYRSGMSMGFDFLHEDDFGPDNHYASVEGISSMSYPGDYSSGGIE